MHVTSLQIACAVRNYVPDEEFEPALGGCIDRE